MPTNVKIIHARDFVRATPGGLLDRNASEKLLFDVAMAVSSLSDCEVLVDTRNATTVMSTADLWSLAQTVAMYRQKLSRKTAVLCPLQRFDYAKFFAICADAHGLNVRAFLTYEHAIEWLIADDTAAVRLQQ